jgi:HPt (histidine-containing phosphotransfer) domain-containing protein
MQSPPPPSPTGPAKAENREFSFGDEGNAGGAGGHASELLAIFQREAREALVALQGHLEALARKRNDLGVAGHVERIFHTLKGASATVGLADVSAIAAGLQEHMEGVIHEGNEMTPELLRREPAGTDGLRTAPGVPNVTCSIHPRIVVFATAASAISSRR